jgi:hypothetical protein
MGKTHRRERKEPAELIYGSVLPEHVLDEERRAKGLVYKDTVYFATHYSPHEWGQ